MGPDRIVVDERLVHVHARRWLRRLDHTHRIGLAQIVGQVQTSDRDFQSIPRNAGPSRAIWANLETHLDVVEVAAGDLG